MNTKKEERDEDTQQLGDDHLHSAVEDAQSEPPILTFILRYTKNKTIKVQVIYQSQTKNAE